MRTIPADEHVMRDTFPWLPIKTAPRNGTTILIRFGSDGISQGSFHPDKAFPWRFIDESLGEWLINYAKDGPGGPTHWAPLPK